MTDHLVSLRPRWAAVPTHPDDILSSISSDTDWNRQALIDPFDPSMMTSQTIGGNVSFALSPLQQTLSSSPGETDAPFD
jgi:hypothetical protein